jgi:hypothetical protein
MAAWSLSDVSTATMKLGLTLYPSTGCLGWMTRQDKARAVLNALTGWDVWCQDSQLVQRHVLTGVSRYTWSGEQKRHYQQIACCHCGNTSFIPKSTLEIWTEQEYARENHIT